MSIDEEAQALFNKWQAQQNAIMGNQTHPSGDMSMGTDQSPHLMDSGRVPTGPDQTPLNPVNSVRPMGNPIKQQGQVPQPPSMGNLTQPPPGQGAPPTPAQMPDVCRECGTMHPPVPHGQKCPNASVAATPDNPQALDDQTVNKHLVELKNIILAQISTKEIKNQKKFFQFAVIELTKALEGYSE